MEGGELGEGLSALLNQVLHGVELVSDEDESEIVVKAHLIDLLEEIRDKGHRFLFLKVKVIPHFLVNLLDHLPDFVIYTLHVEARKSFLNCLNEKEKYE